MTRRVATGDEWSECSVARSAARDESDGARMPTLLTLSRRNLRSVQAVYWQPINPAAAPTACALRRAKFTREGSPARSQPRP
jgi:hypothetical protein